MFNRLASIARARRQLVDVDDPDVEAIADALDAFLAGRADTLDEALGLPRRRPGERTRATELAINERNRIVREAAARHYPALRPAAQAKELATELGRFRATAWVRECEAETCPARHLGSVQEACWHILRCRDNALGEEAIRKILGTSFGSTRLGASSK